MLMGYRRDKLSNTTASEISGSPEEISWSPEGALCIGVGGTQMRVSRPRGHSSRGSTRLLAGLYFRRGNFEYRHTVHRDVVADNNVVLYIISPRQRSVSLTIATLVSTSSASLCAPTTIANQVTPNIYVGQVERFERTHAYRNTSRNFILRKSKVLKLAEIGET
jgi:hypothetical protein